MRKSTKKIPSASRKKETEYASNRRINSGAKAVASETNTYNDRIVQTLNNEANRLSVQNISIKAAKGKHRRNNASVNIDPTFGQQ